MEIPGGRGEQPEALWNGKSGGVGAQTVNNPPWGGYGYFLELHIVIEKNSPLGGHELTDNE